LAIIAKRIDSEEYDKETIRSVIQRGKNGRPKKRYFLDYALLTRLHGSGKEMTYLLQVRRV